MGTLMLTAASAATALLAGPVALAGADVGPRAPTPTPTPIPTATPTATPTPTPADPVVPIDPVTGLPTVPIGIGTLYVVTVTTTTTTVAAPITVVAAPITTSNTTNMAPAGAGALTGAGAGAAAGALNPAPSSRPGLLVVNLRGCAAPARAAKDTTRRPATGRAQVRLPRDTTLVVRVNGRRVSTLQLDGGRGPAAKPLPLRLTLRRDGTLTVRRPSGQVLLTQGCAAN